MRLLGQTDSEGFKANVWEDPRGRCFMIGDLDVDADGANGQNGKQAAYMIGDRGSEFLKNGGMRWDGRNVRGVTSWWKDIVYEHGGEPLVLPSGVIPSRTAYKLDARDRPEDQLDSETVAYIVLPSFCVAKVKGIVKGCRARASYKRRVVECVVGDIGPRTKVGEGSIELCRQLGIPHSPRDGGWEKNEILYEWWPGEFGKVDGMYIPLMASNGTYKHHQDDKTRIAGIDQAGSSGKDQHGA